MSDEAP
jgi:hypothetical protein